MSQSQLHSFIEKLVHEVPEGQSCARRVKLMFEGTTIDTWEPVIGLDPDTWCREAEVLISQMILELPKRRVQLQFFAEDNAGVVIATMPRTVLGQNPTAQDLGTQNGAKALADALSSVAKTGDAVLEQARRMMDFQAGIIDKQNTTLFEYHELFMAIRKAELETAEQDSAVKQIVVEQLKNAGPTLMTLLEHIVTRPAKAPNVAPLADVVKAVTNGAHTP
jgi:hypothetical protein